MNRGFVLLVMLALLTATVAPGLGATRRNGSRPRHASGTRGTPAPTDAGSEAGSEAASGSEAGPRPEAGPATPALPELVLQTGHAGAAYQVLWSPEGRHFASGSLDNTLRIWDAAAGLVVASLDRGGIPLWWSRDSNALTYSDRRGRVYQYRIDEGSERRVFPHLVLPHLEPRSMGLDIAYGWSPSRKQVAIGERAAIRIVDAATGATVRTFPSQRTNLIAWSPDGKYLACGNWQVVRLLNPRDGKVLQTLRSEGWSTWTPSITWSPDGSALAWGSLHQALYVWEATTGKISRGTCDAAVLHVAWSADSTRLASFGYRTKDRSVSFTAGMVWDRRTLTPVPIFDADQAYAGQVPGWNADGHTLAVSDGGGALHLLDIGPGVRDRVLRGASSPINQLAWDETGRRLASGAADGTIRTWNMETGRPEPAGRPDLAQPAFKNENSTQSPDGRTRVELSQDNSPQRLSVLVIEAGGSRSTTDFPGMALRVAWRPDSQALAVAYHYQRQQRWLSTIKIVEISRNTVRIHQLPELTAFVDALAWTGNGNTLGVGLDTGAIALLDTSSGVSRGEFRVDNPSLGHRIRLLRTAPDGRTLLAVNGDGEGQLWDLATRKTLPTPRALGDVAAAAWSPDSARLAVADHSGRITAIRPARPGAEAVSLIGLSTSERQDWITVTEHGYFVSSLHGADQVRWRQGARLSPVSLFRERFERPDVVKRALAGEALTEQALLSTQFPPILRFDLPQPGEAVSGATIPLAMTVQSWGQLDRVELLVDGRPLPEELRRRLTLPEDLDGRARWLEAELQRLRSGRAGGAAAPAGGAPVASRGALLEKALAAQKVADDQRRAADAGSGAVPAARGSAEQGLDRCTFTLDLPVPLGSRPITLRAVAYDRDGLQSPPVSMTVPRAGQSVAGGRDATGASESRHGRLFLLGVGVSRYAHPRIPQLRYAARDVQELTALLNGAPDLGQIERVAPPPLLDENVRQASLDEYLKAPLARQLTPDDVVMVFLSGHGYSGNDGRYFFATHETDPDALTSTALAWDHLTARLQDLAAAAGRVYLFADTCRSAGLIGDQGSESRLAQELRTRSGVVAFLSSEGYSPSYEADEFGGGHGAFAAALLEAFGRPSLARLSAGELDRYLEERVPLLTRATPEPQRPMLAVLEGAYDPDEALLPQPRPAIVAKRPQSSGVTDASGRPFGARNDLKVNLTGSWTSPQWGALRLLHQGTRVYGTYRQPGGSTGQIDGFVRGTQVRFWWWQGPPRSQYGAAESSRRGDGYFTITGDNRVLTGAFRREEEFKENRKPDRPWSAKRAGRLPVGNYVAPAFAVPSGAAVWPGD